VDRAWRGRAPGRLRPGPRDPVPVRGQAPARLERCRRLCEVLAAHQPDLLRYTWADAGGGAQTEVTYHLEPTGDGTRFTYEHTGFTGVGGWFMAQFLGRVRRTMLTDGLPAVLARLNQETPAG
jgi:uncharacterized protein YndB with AHSA1/START domain